MQVQSDLCAPYTVIISNDYHIHVHSPLYNSPNDHSLDQCRMSYLVIIGFYSYYNNWILVSYQVPPQDNQTLLLGYNYVKRFSDQTQAYKLSLNMQVEHTHGYMHPHSRSLLYCPCAQYLVKLGNVNSSWERERESSHGTKCRSTKILCFTCCW